jgi:acetyl-CoA carboxylase carboxyl transferase subunit alpha
LGLRAQSDNALKLTGSHLLKFGVVDCVIPEPLGGAHRNPESVAQELKKIILKYIKELTVLSKEELLEARYQKYRSMGAFEEHGQDSK